MSDASTRLREARERSNRTVSEVAERAGISAAAYYDLEADPEDFRLSPSIAEIIRVATTVGVDPYWLACGTDNPTTVRLSSAGFTKHIESIARTRGRSIKDLEDDAGYRIAPALENPVEILDWNLDYIEAVCRIADVELGSVLNVDLLR
jgi:transcriptional regulator with XRE-family HTH domain